MISEKQIEIIFVNLPQPHYFPIALRNVQVRVWEVMRTKKWANNATCKFKKAVRVELGSFASSLECLAHESLEQIARERVIMRTLSRAREELE